LVVFHIFDHKQAGVNVPLPPGDGWHIQEQFIESNAECGLFNGALVFSPKADFSAAVILLNRD
jgi:hypothetical protein